MNFKHLTDIHTRRHAQRVQHDIQGTSVGQEGHILYREHTGNDTFITVTSRHFISHRDLSLLRDVDAHCLVHTRGQLVAILPCKYLCVNNNTILAMRYFERSIPYLPRLLAKDRPEQSLFSSQLRLTLRGHLADKDISRAHFRADADDPPLIQVFQGIVTHTRDVSCDLLRSELCISCLRLIFLNMDRSINIILYQSLA